MFFRNCFASCLISTIFIVILLGVGANQVRRFYFQVPRFNTPTVPFVVEEGDVTRTVAERLEDQGVIASEFWFRIAARLSSSSKNVKPGIHDIQPGTNYTNILRLLSQDQSSEVTLTIPEGYTLKQIGAAVQDEFNVSAAEWQRLTGVDSPFETHPFIVAAKKPDSVDLEGYLFPDTYRFFKNATGEDIVKKLLDTMEQKVTSLDEPSDRALDLTFHERMTLASILEREVRGATDMKMVSDLFLKRLEIGMALQADSTVNYITGGESASISYDDRDNTDSPYNTYKHPGLPPGPISNPGLNALAAAWHPTPNDYLYFLTDPAGKVYYAKTYDTHLENKRLYMR